MVDIFEHHDNLGIFSPIKLQDKLVEMEKLITEQLEELEALKQERNDLWEEIRDIKRELGEVPNEINDIDHTHRCPNCWGKMVCEEVVCTYPPIPVYVCEECGYRQEGEEK